MASPPAPPPALILNYDHFEKRPKVRAPRTTCLPYSRDSPNVCRPSAKSKRAKPDSEIDAQPAEKKDFFANTDIVHSIDNRDRREQLAPFFVTGDGFVNGHTVQSFPTAEDELAVAWVVWSEQHQPWTVDLKADDSRRVKVCAISATGTLISSAEITVDVKTNQRISHAFALPIQAAGQEIIFSLIFAYHGSRRQPETVVFCSSERQLISSQTFDKLGLDLLEPRIYRGGVVSKIRDIGPVQRALRVHPDGAQLIDAAYWWPFWKDDYIFLDTADYSIERVLPRELCSHTVRDGLRLKAGRSVLFSPTPSGLGFEMDILCKTNKGFVFQNKDNSAIVTMRFVPSAAPICRIFPY
jgi:hypothetical protein